MRYNILISLIILIIFIPTIYSYEDYGINDIIAPQSIKAGEDLNYSILLSNNSSSISDINVTTSVKSPSNSIIYSHIDIYTVSANTTSMFNKIIDANFVSANDPYSLYSTITNETAGNIGNNSYTKYFTVKKGNRKMTIPDMPILLGFIIAISMVLVLSRTKLKINRKQK